MHTRDIPRNEWQSELDQFSREHEGCVARVEVTSGAGQPQTEARDLPLEGISIDSPKSDAIAIVLGDKPDDHLTHEVASAVAVTMEEGDNGDDRGVRIRGADGTLVHVECRQHRP
jgi:hypothetical protein